MTSRDCYKFFLKENFKKVKMRYECWTCQKRTLITYEWVSVAFPPLLQPVNP